MTDGDLIALLGARVDVVEARKRIAAVNMRLGLRSPYSQAQALDVLEGLASGEGLVAVLARFAKARVLLSA